MSYVWADSDQMHSAFGIRCHNGGFIAVHIDIFNKYVNLLSDRNVICACLMLVLQLSYCTLISAVCQKVINYNFSGKETFSAVLAGLRKLVLSSLNVNCSGRVAWFPLDAFIEKFAVCFVWDLRFLHLWRCQLRSSRLWRLVVLCVVTDVSTDCVFSILRLDFSRLHGVNLSHSGHFLRTFFS
jgi:hypothetical protein